MDDSSGISNKRGSQKKLNKQEVKQLQHEITIHAQKWTKEKIGKGSNYIKVIIHEDMVIYRGEGILTEPEKFITQVYSGGQIVREARRKVLTESWHELKEYLENKLNVKVIHHVFDIEPENDFWMHIVVFDCYLS